MSVYHDFDKILTIFIVNITVSVWTLLGKLTALRQMEDEGESATRVTGCLHGTIVGPTGRPDPGYVRLVGQTSRTDRSDRL